MRKPAFCICKNKDADQLCGNHEADQRLCFRYTYNTIPLLPKSESSSRFSHNEARLERTKDIVQGNALRLKQNVLLLKYC